MSKRRKILGILAISALVAGVSISGTMAYLTDRKEVTNNFTVGKVEIEGSEPDWDPDGDGEPGGIAEHVVPTQSWAKNPQIRNVGENPAYVFIEVRVPMADVVYTNSQSIRQNNGEPAHIELFEFDSESATTQTLSDGVGISEQNSEWTQIKKEELDGNMVYTFCYNSVLDPESTTSPLFDRITFANVVEGQIDGQNLAVDVRFHAIQVVDTVSEAGTPEAAKEAFNLYLNQNQTLAETETGAP